MTSHYGSGFYIGSGAHIWQVKADTKEFTKTIIQVVYVCTRKYFIAKAYLLLSNL